MVTGGADFAATHPSAGVDANGAQATAHAQDTPPARPPSPTPSDGSDEFVDVNEQLQATVVALQGMAL